MEILISFSKHHKMIMSYTNIIFDEYIFFNDHACGHGNHTKYDLYKVFLKKREFLPHFINYKTYYKHLWETVIYSPGHCL